MSMCNPSVGFRVGKYNGFSYTGTVGTWNARADEPHLATTVAGQSAFALIDDIRRGTASSFGHQASGSLRQAKPASTRWSSSCMPGHPSEGRFLPLFSFRDSVRGGGKLQGPERAHDEDTRQSGVKTSSLVICFSVRRGVKVLKFH